MDSGCNSQIGGMHMNSVGIDISKCRSMVVVFGEAIVSPFEVRHTDNELSKLTR